MKNLNRNILKYIAIIAMLMDHTAMSFCTQTPWLYFVLRFAGRLTAPIMSFFIVEGFIYTRSQYKYGLRLGIFALISQFAYTYFNEGSIFTIALLTDWNVIFTLFIGYCVLLVYEKEFHAVVKWIIIVALCAVSCLGDWMIIVPLWILFLYMYKDNRKKRFVFFSILTAIEVLSCIPFIISHGELWQVGILFVIPLLLMYNGQPGNNKPFFKWVFYAFYPLHLLVIGFIRHMPVG